MINAMKMLKIKWFCRGGVNFTISKGMGDNIS